MIRFCKYNANGNDFIIIDNRKGLFLVDHDYIKKICHREVGIGADGFILLEKDFINKDVLYFINYFNSDGLPSSFCGNGSMCSAHFAVNNDITSGHKKGLFSTREGVFSFNVCEDRSSISMIDVSEFSLHNNNIIINTGSPHFVVFGLDLDSLDVNKEGKKIRFSAPFLDDGINVTFASFSNNKIHIRTYERGVESETQACGTGAVAAALSASILNMTSQRSIVVKTLGGPCLVNFEKKSEHFFNIWLSSHVEKNFEQNLTLS